ncbi:MFS transporter [Cellulomonas sp. KRMCY2]|uniref:MFS transporter n=1 Tax=Cellulomonas sp. KRMCY2 TaxID=1304865 RepID=UPI00045E7E08|nr:MFS transporter [Cellulomonas sp. KRMCY2]
MSTPIKEITYSPFRWVVLATLFIVTATTALALISPAPLIPNIFGSQFADPAMIDQVLKGEVPLPDGLLSIGQIAWMTMGWFNLAVAVAALLGGYFVDKLGFVWIYVIGIALIVTGWLLVGTIGDTYNGMMVIRTIQGIGTGPIMASAAAVAATRFPIKERSIVTGTQGAAMSAGIGLGLAFMPKLAVSQGGWESALVSLWPVAVVALAMTAVVAFGPKQAPVEAVAESAEQVAEAKHALRKALATPTVWAAIACIVILSWVFQAFNDLTPAYLRLAAPVGVGFANGSTLLSYAQIANFLGAFAGGIVTERFFRGRVRPALTIGFTMGAVFGLGLLLPAATSSAGLMAVFLCVAAFFFAWVNPNALGYIAKTFPASITGKLGGYAMGIGVFGGTAGVAAGAAALHATGRYTVSILIMVGVCALGVVPALFLRQAKADKASLMQEAASSVSSILH